MTTTQPQFKSEDQLQAYLWKIARNEFPKSNRHIWAVPNAGKRSDYEQQKLKATGLLKGVWDLHCFYGGKFYIFELKFGKNKLDPDQKRWGALMIEQGAIHYEIRENEVDKFRSIMAGIFGPPRIL